MHQCERCYAMVPDTAPLCPACGAPQPAGGAAASRPAAQPTMRLAMPSGTPPRQAAASSYAMPPQVAQPLPPQAVPPQPLPPQPVQPLHQPRFRSVGARAARTVVSAALMGAAFAIAAALAFTLLTMIFDALSVSSFARYVMAQVPGLSDAPSSSDGMFSQSQRNEIASTVTPSVWTLVGIVMAMGMGGSWDLGLEIGFFGYGGSGKGEIVGSMGIVGLSMVIAAAFGAYLFARSGHGRRQRWTVPACGLGCGLVTLAAFAIIAGTGRHNKDYMSIITSTYTALTPRSCLLAFLTAALGAALGMLLGNRAPGARGVFAASWRWLHRQGGSLRTLGEGIVFSLLLFGVASIPYSLLMTMSIGAESSGIVSNPGDVPAAWIAAEPLGAWSGVVPLLPSVMLYLMLVCCFGRVTLQFSESAPYGVSSLLTQGSSLPSAQGHDALAELRAGAGLGSFSWLKYSWFAWVVFGAFMLLTVYLVLRAAGRYRVDRDSARMSTVWQAPLVMLLMAAIVQFAFMMPSGILAVDLSSILGSGATGGLRAVFVPAVWDCVLPAVWIFLVDGLGRLLGAGAGLRPVIGTGGGVYPGEAGAPLKGLAPIEDEWHVRAFLSAQAAALRDDDEQYARVVDMNGEADGRGFGGGTVVAGAGAAGHAGAGTVGAHGVVGRTEAPSWSGAPEQTWRPEPASGAWHPQYVYDSHAPRPDDPTDAAQVPWNAAQRPASAYGSAYPTAPTSGSVPNPGFRN